jgi:hypothetical protein
MSGICSPESRAQALYRAVACRSTVRLSFLLAGDTTQGSNPFPIDDLMPILGLPLWDMKLNEDLVNSNFEDFHKNPLESTALPALMPLWSLDISSWTSSHGHRFSFELR